MIERRARRFALWLTLGAALAAGAAAQAAEGAIPLWEPTAITAPGSYVVTRDISSSVGPVLDIRGGGVSVELNGFTLSVSGAPAPVVRIASVMGVQPQPFRIANGKIQGGMHGIHTLAPDPVHLSLQDLKIEGAGEAAVKADSLGSLEARGIVVVDNKTGFDLVGHPPDPTQPWRPTATIAGASIQGEAGVSCNGVTCEITNSLISACGTSVELEEAEGTVVQGNGFSAPGSDVCFSPKPEPPGIWIKTTEGARIVGNTLHGLSVASGDHHGILVDGGSSDVFIAGNTITGFGDDGIHFRGENGYVMDNLLARNLNGVFVAGVNNLVDGNKIGANTETGIYFETTGHIYRNNVLRGNPRGGVGGQPSNTDGGNNIE